MIKKLFFLLICILILSCNTIKEQRNIDGNWYTTSPKKFDNHTIDYTEIFIKNDTVHICSEYLLRMSPRKMILKKDSLFFHSKIDSNFIGKILKQTKKSFDLGKNNKHKKTYYKLENSKNLERLIYGDITEKEYYLEFNKRKNSIYKKLKTQ